MTDSPGSGIDLNVMAGMTAMPTSQTINVEWNAAACAPQLQNCIVDYPWLAPAHFAPICPVPVQPVVPLQQTHYHFTPNRLADEDVERIARRVAELLREAKP